MLAIIVGIRVLLVALSNSSAKLLLNHVLRLASRDVLLLTDDFCHLFSLVEYVNEGHISTCSA